MKAVQFSRFGGPNVLAVVDVDEPHAGPGQIRIVVKASSVNPMDRARRSGRFKLDLPAGIGRDAAGVVDEVGEGVSDVKVGDLAFGIAVDGAGTAEFSLLRRWAKKPERLSYAETAALPIAAETATRCLRKLAATAGQTLLINGAAGSVGQAAVQLARRQGLRVIGTASEGNHARLREIGAEPVVYGAGLVDRVRELAPGGVDFVLDCAGQALGDLVELAGDAARVLTVAGSTLAAEYGVRSTAGGGKDAAYDAYWSVAKLADQGEFSLPVQRTFTMAQASEAHALSEAAHLTGKIVIVIE